MKVGILGTGWIADKMAVTLTGLDKKEGIELYAVASRSKEKAEKFDYDFQKKCVEERNYEKLELYVLELLMGLN